MTPRLLILALGFTLTAAAAIAPTAANAQVFWSSAATGCVPSRPSIANRTYQESAGSVRFRITAAGTPFVTGTITLRCPVQVGRTVSSAWSLGLNLYFLGTDATQGYFAGAVLKATNKVTGVTTDLLSASSVSSAPTTSFTQPTKIGSVKLGLDLDLETNLHWIELTLNRTGGARNPTIFGVELAVAPQ